MHGLEEVKRSRLFARRIRKLHAVFTDKGTGLQLLQQSHSLKGKVGVSHQRFADVMAREDFLLKQHNTAAFPGQNAGDGAARRTPADHNHVVVMTIGSHKYLGVTNSSQFRFKKLDQKIFHFQQAAARQNYLFVFAYKHFVRAQSFIDRLKFLPDIHAELIAKVRDIKRAVCKLQNDLPDQTLVRRQRNRAQKRQLVGAKDTNIVLEVMRILKMHAVEIRERRHARPDRVSAVPEGVGVNEPAMLFLAHQRSGAGKLVAM